MLYTLSLHYPDRKPTGAKLALKPFHVWGIRVRLQVGRRTLVCEVRKENEREAEQRPALHWRSQSLLGHLIDRGQGSTPNLRYAESHAEHE